MLFLFNEFIKILEWKILEFFYKQMSQIWSALYLSKSVYHILFKI